MVAFAEPSRPTRRAPARPCEGSSSCVAVKNPVLRSDRNQQYSITALTNASGTITERYSYTAYGQPTFFDGSGTVISASAESNRHTYTGREWDEELRLYHYRARMYDSVAGRFCSRDPISYEGSRWLLYGYVGHDPLGTTDPFGLWDWGQPYNPPDIEPDYPRIELGGTPPPSLPIPAQEKRDAKFDENMKKLANRLATACGGGASQAEIDAIVNHIRRARRRVRPGYGGGIGFPPITRIIDLPWDNCSDCERQVSAEFPVCESFSYEIQTGRILGFSHAWGRICTTKCKCSFTIDLWKNVDAPFFPDGNGWPEDPIR